MSDQLHRPPAFQFYPDDFLAGTSDMSAEEVGAYIRLLCHQWSKGSIPNDEERAGRMAGLIGSPSLRYVLAKFSPCDDGQLRNKRLEEVRDESAQYRTRQAQSGAAGAAKRWAGRRKDGNPIGGANGNAMATPLATPMANRWPEDSSPPPPPSIERDSIGEGKWPKLDEVLTVASMRGIPATAAEAFWNHFEAQGWQTKDGLPIVSWQPKLASWWVNEQARAQKAKTTGPGNYGHRRAPLPVTPDDATF